MRDSENANRLCTFWHGSQLGWLEQLCATSMIATGHEVDLYCYHDVGDVPDGVTVKDARSIMPEKYMIANRRSKSFALGSDIFRYQLQKEQMGTWIDLDILMMRKFNYDTNYIFYWEGPRITCSILKLPSYSNILLDLLELCGSKPVVPPWWSESKKISQRMRCKIGLDTPPEKLRWGSFGPIALTWFVKKHQLEREAGPSTTFFPIDASRIDHLFLERYYRPDMVTEAAVGVHLYNSDLKKRKVIPEPGSFIARRMELHGIPLPKV